ncbi:putative molybdopterin converting factor small subunit MoaD [Leifsonia rubra CMS 76R]|nr:putative molybdopterin converting factor small subunit MoaD [Leifsonia rubra CMS 76R]
MADMTLHIRYFAAAADAAGRDEEQLVIEDGATLNTLKVMLIDRYGELMQRVVESGSFLIDGVVRRDPAESVGSRVDVLPPFAGG